MRDFLGVYYKWGLYEKYSYEKTTIEKDVNKLVEGYKKYTGSHVKVQKTPCDTGKNISKSDLEEPYNINKYRSFAGQLIWYTTKVVPDVENAANVARLFWQCK